MLSLKKVVVVSEGEQYVFTADTPFALDVLNKATGELVIRRVDPEKKIHAVKFKIVAVFKAWNSWMEVIDEELKDE